MWQPWQTSSRSRGGRSAGLTMLSYTRENSTGSRIAARACSAPGPWQRWQPTPSGSRSGKRFGWLWASLPAGTSG